MKIIKFKIKETEKGPCVEFIKRIDRHFLGAIYPKNVNEAELIKMKLSEVLVGQEKEARLDLYFGSFVANKEKTEIFDAYHSEEFGAFNSYSTQELYELSRIWIETVAKWIPDNN